MSDFEDMTLLDVEDEVIHAVKKPKERLVKKKEALEMLKSMDTVRARARQFQLLYEGLDDMNLPDHQLDMSIKQLDFARYNLSNAMQAMGMATQDDCLENPPGVS
jgi:uncharacterized protein YcaQ